MKFFQGLFSRKKAEKEEPRPEPKPKQEKQEDLLAVARLLGPLVDRTANDTLKSYQVELLAQPITFIVPAVWGATQDGKLSELQQEIHQKLRPAINEIIAFFAFKEISPAQEFALGYLVRGLIISKITYMIETLRNERLKQDKDLLSRLDPIGKA